MSFTAATGVKGLPDPVDQQLREVEDRLVARYSGQAGLSEQVVRQHFAEVRGGLRGGSDSQLPADPDRNVGCVPGLPTQTHLIT